MFLNVINRNDLVSLTRHVTTFHTNIAQVMLDTSKEIITETIVCQRTQINCLANQLIANRLNVTEFLQATELSNKSF